MKWYFILLIVFAGVLLLLFLFLIYASKPGKRREGIREFTRVKYAHRGLHNEERAENSLSAFRAAMENGFGIELDVRLCRSGELVVFHDADLQRVTGAAGKVIDKTLAELKALRLSGTEEAPPTLDEVLALVDGKTPLLIEIKEDFGERGVAEKTTERLKRYEGKYIIESFNPLAVGKVKKKLPAVYRGILSTDFLKTPSTRKLVYALLQHMRLNFIAKPDFIAYEHTAWQSLTFRFLRKIYRPATFAWTIRSAEEEKEAYAHGFDAVIFENYIPEN